jgi:hypothetical protein
MSSASSSATWSSTFGALFNVALEKYTKKTGKDLRNHPLASEIDSCDSPDSIINIFQEQARAFDEFKRGDTQLFKWLKPVVNVLHALSTNDALKDSVSLVSLATFLIICILEHSILQAFPPAKAIFCGIGILLSVRICLIISAPFLVTSRAPRRPNMWGQVTKP